MNSRKLLINVLYLIVLICLVFQFNSIFAFGMEENKTSKIILLDPGHGGRDGGAVSKNGTVEKDINLKIGLKLRDKLKAQGYTVFMTRETDKGLYDEDAKNKKKQDLANRNKMKRDVNCNMFVSIHLNMFPKQKYKGGQIWYTENEDSRKLAHIMQDKINKELYLNDNRVEKPGSKQYRVLEGDEIIPSVIVECGFLSNYEDEKKLKTSEYQDKVAEVLCKAIDEFYKN
ncbi:MAG: N-acetylmuramoyl-L-alanine amidase CwlD [Bacillota bacterium]|nr:N-acetylmuramoyl-L-alanine amidase CwlD [Bacillota bacterium]